MNGPRIVFLVIGQHLIRTDKDFVAPEHITFIQVTKINDLNYCLSSRGRSDIIVQTQSVHRLKVSERLVKVIDDVKIRAARRQSFFCMFREP